jgi:hypothetical protein
MGSRVRGALAVIAAFFLAAPAGAQVRYAPDVTVELSGTTVADEKVADDDLMGTVGLANLGNLPVSVEVDAYTSVQGESLFSLDTTAALPGAVTIVPADIVRYDGASYTIEFDAIGNGIPDSANVDAVMQSGGFW